MTIHDESIPAHRERASLLQRRPGHAVITHLLELMGPGLLSNAAPSVPPDLRGWYEGAIGELIVGHELGRLPPEWRVLHSIPAGRKGRDIDHLVLGPGGVFALNAKRHVGANVRVGTHLVWVNQSQKHYQSEAAKAADEVQELLSSIAGDHVVVHPVLVFVQAGRFAHVGPQHVPALQSENLLSYLQGSPPVLSPELLAQLVDAAAEPSTWGADRRLLDQPDPTARFLGLRSPTTSQAHPAPRARVRPQAAAPSSPARARRQTGRRSDLQRGNRAILRLVLGVLGVVFTIPLMVVVLGVLLQFWVALISAH